VFFGIKKTKMAVSTGFYREQAALLLRLVRELADPTMKSELLEIVDRLRHLADSSAREPHL
jgi:hypothetical protein